MPRASAATTTAERRQMLLDAAVGVVREQGPRASMEAMAAAGDVTKPILYRHFGDRQGLVTAIGHGFLSDLNEAIGAALRSFEPPGDGSILRATIDAYLGLIERDTELYRFLVQQDARSGRETTSDFVGSVIDQVAGLIAGALQTAGRSSAPAELWAVAIVGMVHTGGDWWAERRSAIPKSTVVDELTNLLWLGLKAATSPVPTDPAP